MIQKHDLVKLIAWPPDWTEHKHKIFIGSVGTIIHVYEGGEAFAVEFHWGEWMVDVLRVNKQYLELLPFRNEQS